MKQFILCLMIQVMFVCLPTALLQAADVSYLDLGYYKIYRLSEDEIAHMSKTQLQQVLEIYQDRFYPLYMFFSRSYVESEINNQYPADLMQPLIDKIRSQNEEQLRAQVRDLCWLENGVSLHNQKVHNQISQQLAQFEQQKFGRLMLNPRDPIIQTPQEILQAYQFKMGLLSPKAQVHFFQGYRDQIMFGLFMFLLGIFASVLNGKTNRLFKNVKSR